MEDMGMSMCARRWRGACSSPRAILVLLVISTGWLQAVRSQEATTYSGGMSVYLGPGAGQQGGGDQQFIFQVAPGAPLRATFGFFQSYPETKTFRVFFLLNYAQIPVGYQEIPAPDWDAPPEATPSAIPGGQLHRVLEFSVAPEIERYYTIWSAPLPQGYYDLALIVAPDPDLNQRELPYFTRAQFPVRASVYVGTDAAPPAVTFPLFDPEAINDGVDADILWFGQEPHQAGLKSSQAVSAGADVTLTVNYRLALNAGADDLPADIAVPVAIVGILDDRVVPIKGKPMWYSSAIPGRLNDLPVTVRVPDAPGVHQFFLQQFPNPYTDVAWAAASGREHVGVSSQRFILDVQ